MPCYRTFASISGLCEKGHLGTKTGKGLYDWTPESIAEVQQARRKEVIESLKKDRNFVPFKVRT